MAVAIVTKGGLVGNSHVTAPSISLATSGSNTALLLFVEKSIQFGGDTLTATYNGVSLTKLVETQLNVSNAELWYLLAPASGSHTLAVSFNNTDDPFNFAAIALSGVKQSAPSIYSAAGYWGGLASNVIASASGDLHLAYAAGQTGGATFASPFTDITADCGGAYTETVYQQQSVAQVAGAGGNITANITTPDIISLIHVRLEQAPAGVDGTAAATFPAAVVAATGAVGTLAWKVATTAAGGTVRNMTVVSVDRGTILDKGSVTASGGYFSLTSTSGLVAGTKRLTFIDNWDGDGSNVLMRGGPCIATLA